MSLNPKITKDANGKYYLEWEPDLTCDGYAFETPKGTSRTFNNAVARVGLGTQTEPFTASVSPVKIVPAAKESATYPATTPVPPTPTGVALIGVSTGGELPYHSAADRNRELDECKSMGANSVRFDYADNQQSIDCTNAVKDRGMTPIMILFGTDRNPRTDPGGMPMAAANRWKGILKRRVYEILNEPDLNGWVPSNYAAFAKKAADQIKAVDGAAEVWCGGFFKGGDAANKIPQEFAKALVAANVKFDAFSGHYFDDDPNWNDKRNGWHYCFPHGDWPAGYTVREILDASGRKNVQIVSSESHAFDANEASQAAKITKYINYVKDGKLGAMEYYRMRAEGDRPDSSLLRPDWSHKQSWTAFKNAVS